MLKIKSSENFVKTDAYLAGILLHYFNMNKTVEEAHQDLQYVYSTDALDLENCRNWFIRFRNGDFKIEDKEQGEMSEENSDDEDLEKLFEENTAESFNDSTEHGSTTNSPFTTTGMVEQEGNWILHDIQPREMERRVLTCELLLQRQNRKHFLNRIIVGNERWIYYNKFNYQGPSSSMAGCNIDGLKVLLCIWWDEQGVISYQVLRPDETYTVNRYLEQLVSMADTLSKLRPEWNGRMHKIVLMHDKSQNHMEDKVIEYLKRVRWNVIYNAPFSPDLSPSEYHLFKPMEDGLSDANLFSFEDCKSWIDEWITSKNHMFFQQGIHALPEKWAQTIASDGKYYI